MVDKTPRRVREMFDRISPTYDFLNHLLSLNTDVAWRRRAAQACGSNPALVLDLACGTGDLSLEIRRKRGCRVVGADFAMRMLQLARRKARKAVDFAQADALRLPFRDGAFDACTIAFGLRNLADPIRGLREMARVVKPGGRVVVLEFTLPKGRLLKKAYLAYFNHVLPTVARAISGSQAYRYLATSVNEWWAPSELGGKMQGAGMDEVTSIPLSFGVAAIHTGRRPLR